MANDMFTNRFGKQVPVKPYTIEPAQMVSILRLKEDFEARGEHLSTHGVVLHLLDKGISLTRNYWKNVDRNKNRRDFAKAVTPFILNPVKYAAEIQELARKFGFVAGGKVDMSAVDEPDSDENKTEDELLEELTAPSGAVVEQIEQLA
jgi:hypothetical protein